MMIYKENDNDFLLNENNKTCCYYVIMIKSENRGLDYAWKIV